MRNDQDREGGRSNDPGQMVLLNVKSSTVFMSLIRDLIFWLMVRCWRAFVAIGLLFLGICLYLAGQHYWSRAKKDMASFQNRIEQAKTEITEQLNVKASAYWHMEDLNTKKPWTLDPKMFAWSKEYKLWELAYSNAEKSHKKANELLSSLEDELNDLRSGKWWLISVFEKSWAKTVGYLGAIVFSVFCLPGLWKSFWFYLAAPLASKSSPIQIQIGSFEPLALTTASHAVSVQEIELIPGDTIYTKGEWVNSYPSEGVKKETRLLWSWQTPFISYASGLRELTAWRVTGTTSQVLKLCSGTDPNLKITKINFEPGAALVVRPQNIVAISGNLEITSCWKLLSVHSWVSGRLRYIIISGQGVLYLNGYGDVTSETPQAKQRMSDRLLIAHDPKTPFRTVRTETFWPFLRGKTSLYDLQFEDQGLVIYQSASKASGEHARSIYGRIEGLTELVLKVFGF